MKKERNHLAIPRNVFNITRLYTIYILKKLAKGETIYGKQIYDDIKLYFENYPLSISYSTIYNTLHGMESEGFVVSHWDESSKSSKNRSTRYYRITDEGIRYLKVIEADSMDSLRNTKGLIDRFIEFLNF